MRVINTRSGHVHTTIKNGERSEVTRCGELLRVVTGVKRFSSWVFAHAVTDVVFVETQANLSCQRCLNSLKDDGKQE